MKKKMDIGLEIKQPESACKSSKCPWHGNLKVRGRVFKGVVVSVKASDTAIIEWNYYHYVPKYERYERRKTRIAAHLTPCLGVKLGDNVRIGECRPLSKSKRFVVIEKI